MNPDGTGAGESLYGSGSTSRTVRSMPNRCQVVHTVYRCDFRSSWCDTFRRLMLFDPSKSRKSEKGMLQELLFP